MLTDFAPRGLNVEGIDINPPAPQPTLGQIATSAARLYNPLVSATSFQGPYYDERVVVEDGFDLFAPGNVIGTKYEPFIDNAIGIFNTKALDKWKLQIDQELGDRQVMDASGLTGWVFAGGAQLADPTLAIPGAALYKGAKGGYLLARSALATGALTATAAAIQEATYQTTQELRTGAEGAFSIGGSFLLGAMLGGVTTGLLSRAEHIAAVRNIEERAAFVGRDHQLDNEVGLQRLLSEAGAARAVPKTAEDFAPSGAVARGLTKAAAMVRASIGARWVNYENPLLKEAMAQIVHNHYYLNAHMRGESTGVPVETAKKVWLYSSDVGATTVGVAADRAYKAFVKGGGRLSRDDFGALIVDAVANGLKSDVPEVLDAARQMQRVFEFQRSEAESAGIPLRKQTDTPGYVPYMWNVDELNANEAAAKEIATTHYANQTKAAIAEAQARVEARVATLQSRIDDLASPGRLQDIKAAILAHERANVPFQTLEEGIGALKKRKKELKGDLRPEAIAERQSIIGEIKRQKERGGQAYADYVSQRRELKAREKHIQRLVIDGEDKEQVLSERITDEAVKNLARLEKWAKESAALKERMANEGPDAVAEEIVAKNTAFVRLLEHDNNQQVKISKIRADRLEAEREAAQVAQPAMEVRKERLISAEDVKVTAEQKRIAELGKLADEITRLMESDPEEALKRLESLFAARAEQYAKLIEEAGVKINKLLGQKEKVAGATEARIKYLKEQQDKVRKWYEDRLRDTGESPAEIQAHAELMADNWFAHATGRVDMGTAQRDVVPTKRGFLRDRMISPPYEAIKQFLVREPAKLAMRNAKRTAGDVELFRRFGSADLNEQIGRIQEKYTEMRKGVDEKRHAKLTHEEKVGLRDLAETRDLVRGLHMADQRATPMARVLNGITQLNFMRLLGNILIANLTDTVRGPMVLGLRPYMQHAIKPLLTNSKAFGRLSKELDMAGISERSAHATLEARAGFQDYFNDRSTLENIIGHATDKFGTWTGINLFIDWMKDMSGAVLMNEIRKGVNASEHPPLLAQIGINRGMGKAIKEQMDKYGFDDEGIFNPNTKVWDDADAKRVFYGALNAGVDTIITTPGIADLPLARHNPYLSFLFSMRGFTFSSLNAVAIRGTQGPARRFIGGLVAMTAIGMATEILRAAQNNTLDKLEARGTDYLIAKGLENSGVLAILFDANNVMEKGLGIGIYRPLGGDPGTFDKSMLSAIMGPTGDFVDVLGRLSAHVAGGNLTPGDVNAIKQLVPVANLPPVNAILQNYFIPEWKKAVAD